MPNDSTQVAVKKGESGPSGATEWSHPFGALRHSVNRLFDDFTWPDLRTSMLTHASDAAPAWQGAFAVAPAIDLVERDGEYEIQAELPGLALKDVEVTLNQGMLTIKGEKSFERKEEKEGRFLQERSFGRFQRSFRLPPGVEADKVQATLDSGVLTVKVPKSAEAKQQERRIEVKTS